MSAVTSQLSQTQIACAPFDNNNNRPTTVRPLARDKYSLGSQPHSMALLNPILSEVSTIAASPNMAPHAKTAWQDQNQQQTRFDPSFDKIRLPQPSVRARNNNLSSLSLSLFLLWSNLVVSNVENPYVCVYLALVPCIDAPSPASLLRNPYLDYPHK